MTQVVLLNTIIRICCFQRFLDSYNQIKHLLHYYGVYILKMIVSYCKFKQFLNVLSSFYRTKMNFNVLCNAYIISKMHSKIVVALFLFSYDFFALWIRPLQSLKFHRTIIDEARSKISHSWMQVKFLSFFHFCNANTEQRSYNKRNRFVFDASNRISKVSFSSRDDSLQSNSSYGWAYTK